MRCFIASLTSLNILTSCFVHAAQSTKGIEDLVRRRLPNHVHNFSFNLVNGTTASDNTSTPQNDHYAVSNGANGTIEIEGNTAIALASG